ncbi:MAG: hypothetical protein ACOC84_03950 [Actinomycetota bacterium]
MTGVLLGFGVVAVIVATGFAVAALLPGEVRNIRQGLTPVVYYLTNPALMLVLVAGTDLGAVLGSTPRSPSSPPQWRGRSSPWSAAWSCAAGAPAPPWAPWRPPT